MEKLNNIRNYDEFREAVNEELLWDAVKNLFSKIFGKIDKKLSDAIANFTKKLDGSKSWEETVTYYNQLVTQLQNEMKTSLTAATGPLGVRKVLADNDSVTFIQLQELANKYGLAELTPAKVYEGKPDLPMFNFNNSNDFKAKLFDSVNTKMLDLNKKAGNPYDNNQLQTYLTQNKDIDNVPQGENFQPKPANDKSNVRQDQTGLGESKVFEQNDNPAPTTTNPNQQQQAGPIDKLKEGATNWLTNDIYGYTLDKVKQTKPPAKVGNVDAFDTVAKASKATNLHQNLSRLLRGIVNIPQEKKGDLLKIRDILGSSQGKDANTIKQEMPL